eukprot:TRINITY_DN12357_c0_g1_i1.p1 TRINITY_DN12357_c0_g1~~TRINITY_DN12357_c0_g1_i1.p1  ORF type:complete len:893 (+),score=159.07 TRINITY_DN12357_c0_g1_i1:71-2749(+)
MVATLRAAEAGGGIVGVIARRRLLTRCLAVIIVSLGTAAHEPVEVLEAVHVAASSPYISEEDQLVSLLQRGALLAAPTAITSEAAFAQAFIPELAQTSASQASERGSELKKEAISKQEGAARSAAESANAQNLTGFPPTLIKKWAEADPVAFRRTIITTHTNWPHPESFAESLSNGVLALNKHSLVIVAALLYAWRFSKKEAKAVGLDTAALSGFRALLAFWVFTEHLGLHMINGGGAFVVLSGCVLSTSRVNMETGLIKSPTTSLQKYLEFVWRRLWRVLPLYYFYLAAMWYPEHEADLTSNPLEHAWQSFLNLLTLPRDHPLVLICWWPMEAAKARSAGHLWFIPVIVVLYCLYPVLEFIILAGSGTTRPSRMHLGFVFAACTVLKLVEATWLSYNMPKLLENNHVLFTYLYGCPWLRIPEFMFGMIVPHLALPKSMLQSDFQKSLAYSAVVAADALLVGLICFAWFAPQSELSYMLTDFNVHAPVVAIVMWGLCYGPERSPIGKLLSAPWLIAIGEWGYGIYLNHIYFIQKMGLYNLRFPPCDVEAKAACGLRTFGPSWAWSSAVVAMAMSCLLSWATFRLIEEGFQDLGNSILKRLKGEVTVKKAQPAETARIDGAADRAAPLTSSVNGNHKQYSESAGGNSVPAGEHGQLSSTAARFEDAAEYMRKGAAIAAKKLSNQEKVLFYGLFKQAKEGDNRSPQPWAYQVEARAKWEAWSIQQGQSQEACMARYVDLTDHFKLQVQASAPSEAGDAAKGEAALPLPVKPIPSACNRFEEAAEYMRQNAAIADRKLSNQEKLQFYGLFKQAKEGDNRTAQPWRIAVEARAKWEAWKKEEGQSQEACMRRYIDLADNFKTQTQPPAPAGALEETTQNAAAAPPVFKGMEATYSY